MYIEKIIQEHFLTRVISFHNRFVKLRVREIAVSLAIRLNDSRLVEGVMRTTVYSAFLYHVKNLDHQR